MLDAHAEAGYVVGTPFATEGVYDFAQHGTLTRRVSDLGVARPLYLPFFHACKHS